MGEAASFTAEYKQETKGTNTVFLASLIEATQQVVLTSSKFNQEV